VAVMRGLLHARLKQVQMATEDSVLSQLLIEQPAEFLSQPTSRRARIGASELRTWFASPSIGEGAVHAMQTHPALNLPRRNVGVHCLTVACASAARSAITARSSTGTTVFNI
jgi:hypothetical protein